MRQRNRNTRADYALLASNQKPIAFVEAKSYGTDLGLAQDQLFEYGTGESVPYAIATNGANWAVYKRERQGADLLFKQLLAVSIINQRPTLAAIKLLSLWKGLLTSQTSIDQIAPALSKLIDDDRPLPPPPPPPNSFKLSNPPDVSHRKPTGLLFPDGTQKQISKWNSVLEETTKWLLVNKRLTVDMPWKATPKSNRNTLQQSEIYNKHGTKIKAQIRISAKLFLLTNYDAQSICSITAKLLDDCGVQTSKVSVILAQHGE